MYNEYDEDQVRKTLKTRKKKKLKTKVKISFLIFALCLIGLFLGSDFSKVKSIRINGLKRVTQEEVLKQCDIDEKDFYFLVSKKQTMKKIKEIPQVKNAQVHIDWLGNVVIEIKEAEPIAHAHIGDVNYEINDIGNIVKISDNDYYETLKLLPCVKGFVDEKLLKEFAKGFKDVPSLLQNEMSDIILSPKKADPTRLKCLMKDDKIIYVRIEDLSTKLNNDQFNYDAYKTRFKDNKIFSIEGNHLYLPTKEME